MARMYCTSAQLMSILYISQRTLVRLREAKVLVDCGRNNFDIGINVQSYLAYKCKGLDPSLELDFNREKALLTKAQRELAELELGKERGQLLSRKDIKVYCGRIANNIKTRFLAIPTKTATMIAEHNDPISVKAIMDKYLREVLSEVAKYNPIQDDGEED